MKRLTGLMAAVVIVSACATVSTVDTRNPLNIQAALEEGDRITLMTRDFRHHEVRVVSLSDTALEVEDADGESVLIPYAEIRSLEVRVPRPARTAGAVVGGIVGGAVAAYAVAIAAVVVVLGALSGA
jgi:anti-sigma-K factor RskA